MTECFRGNDVFVLLNFRGMGHGFPRRMEWYEFSGSHAPAWEPVGCFGMVAAGETGLHSHAGKIV